MRRRDKAVKTQRRKALKSRRNALKSARNRRSSAARQETEAARLTRELHEAREEQAATSEVLGVISSSPGELGPVFEAILENATRICGGRLANLFLYSKHEHAFRLAAQRNAPAAYAERWAKNPVLRIDENPRNPLVRLAKTKRVVAIPDLMVEPGYINREPRFVALVEAAGARTHVLIPMLNKGDLIGSIAVYRQEVLPFTDRQIELLRNFAAQAVIAIENARLLNELRQRTDDLSESLEQQTATSKVLQIISSSPGQLNPVFSAVLENAVRICGAKFGILYLVEGDGCHTVAMHDVPKRFAEKRTRTPFFKPPPGGKSPMGRVMATRQVAQIDDITQGLLEGDQALADLAELGGARTVLAVPMLKDADLVGGIVIYRQQVLRFTEKQIELIQNFAAQAVIAIENTRLLSELRESLQQQTATADVLKVISSSPGELEPVFNAMLENAVRICQAKFGVMHRFVGEEFYAVARLNIPQPLDDFLRKRGQRKAIPGSDLDNLYKSKQVVHTIDMLAAPVPSPPAKLAGGRTQLAVPMLMEGELVGAIVIYRQEVRPFTDKQIELVRNFAAQAVIAIENTRLLNELRESLQQQTATSEVLKVISSTPGELEPVFNAMLKNATRICEAKFGILQLSEGESFRAVALHDVPPAYAEWRLKSVLRPGPEHPLGRVARTKQTIHVADILAEPEDARGGLAMLAGARTILNVPMLKENQLIGAISIYRQEVLPFSDKQIELVKNFAAQAVIAIENTRLLNELRESLQQQTATADVLKVISRSTFDLGTVLQTLVESAARLCDADKTNITRQKDGVFFRAEAFGFSAEFMDYVRNIPIQPDRGSGFGRALLERRAVHISDVKADPEYTLVEGQKLGDYRTVLAVPMLREGVVIGVLSLTRSEVRPFSEKHIELATTFADQAAIAIENVRLFDNVEARTRELAKSLEDLRATQDRLVQTQKLASLGQLTAGIAHEIKNPLNFVNNFSGVSAELIDELQDALKGLQIDQKARAEITELTDTLRGNLDKVVQHGKRADTIVKNMLLHSREGSGEHRPVDINAIVEESLNLAYHGARAEKQGFNITLERSLDPTAGEVDVFPQDITRVLLNLISNGFYAATKRITQAGSDGYEPTLSASTRSLGDQVEIRIRDNGTGIPPEVKEKMFNPFFTTKPAGEGTGLGLSISHDIIVKQHGGSIDVDTKPGAYTEFRIVLPRRSATVGKAGGLG
jgi:two-component system, NtrC family, sensor kinase